MLQPVNVSRSAMSNRARMSLQGKASLPATGFFQAIGRAWIFSGSKGGISETGSSSPLVYTLSPVEHDSVRLNLVNIVQTESVPV